MAGEGQTASPAAVEHTDCALCGLAPAREIGRVRDTNLLLPGEFGLVRCAGCGLVYLNPRPTPSAIASYYPATYWPPGPDPDHLPDAGGAVRSILDAVAAHCSGGRVLDVGCGCGLHAAWMRARGLQVVGLEPSPHGAALARERYGLNVIEGRLRDARLPSQSFDAVTFFDVLEHTHDPVAELAEAQRLLTPGGAVFVKVPNIASLQAVLCGKWWYAVDAPRHLYHFSPASLRRVLSAGGFVQVSVRAATDPLGATVFEWSLINRLRALFPVQNGRLVMPASGEPLGVCLEGQVYASVPKPCKRAFRWFLHRVLYAPVSVENWIGRAPTIVGIARK